MTLTTRGRAALALLFIVFVLWANHATGADQVDGDTGRPVSSSVLVHVAGPADGSGGYTAAEDVAWCVAPSVEISYSSNLDGSGTVECSIP